MILVDTSVWVDYLQGRAPALTEHLGAGDILMHQMIIGELACGMIPERQRWLNEWLALPPIKERTHHEALNLIEERRLMGTGLGFIDAHLLCAAVLDGEARLWTRDAPLRRASEACGVAFPEPV